MAIAALLGAPLAAYAASTELGCTTAEALAGGCSTSGSIAGDHVDIGGGTGASGDGRDSSAGDDESATPATEAPCVAAGSVCLGSSTFNVTYPAVAMSDLASFYPEAPSVAGEPDGWALVGLDANFVAGATVHTTSGPLLGVQADVRFTPSSFDWSYGDGAGSTTGTGGRTWEALGLPEFSPTATSHVYATSGKYALDLVVAYTAEFRVGGDAWRGIPGTLRLSAPTSTIVAGDAATVLVQRNCQIDPHGAGC